MTAGTFPLRVVLSTLSGVGCPGTTYGDIQSCLSHVLGWDLFTHELAIRDHWERAAALIVAARPELAPFGIRMGQAMGDSAAVEAVAIEAAAVFPASIDLPRGTDARTEGPIASLRRVAPDVPAIVLIKDGEK